MNKTVWTSFTILCLLSTVFLMGLALNIQPVKASETIYIRADGSIDPPDAPISSVDNVTYTFTGNIYDSIVVERDNIVVNGAGYTLQALGGGIGIDLSGRNNVTIKNANIDGFSCCIYIQSASNNTISGNNITNTHFEGVRIDSSSYNTISGNNITNNDAHGIYIYSSNNNTIQGNNITNNGQGIWGDWSSENTISENNITNNYDYGIRLYGSSNNTISGNNITNNIWVGLKLYWSSNNTVHGNDIANNGEGIGLHISCQNSFYGNNIIDNTHQVYDISWANPIYDPSINVWDDGYPSGGNYWSNYTGVDVYSGPFQNETGRDGIGDTPHVIDGSNQDNYPFMHQGGLIPISINETLADYYFPEHAALNFTYTLNTTMKVQILVEVIWAGVSLYVNWDGTQPTLEDYDAYNPGGAGSSVWEYSPHALPPGTYYFMVYVFDMSARESIEWGTTFNVTLTGYEYGRISDLKTNLLNALPNKVYFLYADPAYMTRPESTYDVASGAIIYGLCTNTQHQGFNTTKHWLMDTGAINTTTIHDATIAMFGGSFPHVSVRYYVENGLTLIKEGWNSTHIWFENRTGNKFALSWTTVVAGHEDFFVIEVFTEGSNIFLFVYGIDWRGTWAGGIYFKEVMLENLFDYKKQYYIFHWVDGLGQDGIPQSSEIVMESSG